tara:strand:+ start:726 stop:905 length:180 start_codon:yes stop_codon:yes gene_type:complete
MINKELLIKILNENNLGLYIKSKPLEEIPSNVGVMYKVNEVDAEKIIDEYNAHLESPEE